MASAMVRQLSDDENQAVMRLTPTTTLEEFCRNPGKDTYDGVRLGIFLVYCTTGKQISLAEGREIVERAKQRREDKARRK